MLRRMYKAPGFAQGKTGDSRSIDNIFDENKKSEPFSFEKRFGSSLSGAGSDTELFENNRSTICF